MRLMLVGHGRMGRLVESLASEYGATVSTIVTSSSGVDRLTEIDRGPAASAGDAGVDMAIDFSVADAVPQHLEWFAARGVSVVIGTTGWSAHESRLRQLVGESPIGVMAAANFSLAVNVLQLLVEDAARRFAAYPTFAPWIHELHHAAKRDAPSGTALQLKAAMENAGYDRPIAVSSTRVGSIPGTHTVGFDGPSETVTLTHTVRDRAVFARGALEAARWLQGKRGWFTMRDMVEASVRHDDSEGRT